MVQHNIKTTERNTIDWQVEWLEWHYSKKFNNLYEINFDEKRNKYNAKVSDYAKTIAHLYQRKLDELIEIIANDDASMEKYIEQEFFT